MAGEKLSSPIIIILKEKGRYAKMHEKVEQSVEGSDSGRNARPNYIICRISTGIAFPHAMLDFLLMILLLYPCPEFCSRETKRSRFGAHVGKHSDFFFAVLLAVTPLITKSSSFFCRAQEGGRLSSQELAGGASD